MQGRTPYLVAAACIGAALALVAYRFAPIALVADDLGKRVFDYLPAALVIVAWQVLRPIEQRRWPIALALVAGVAGAAVAVGVAYVVTPPLSSVHLATKQLPGFTIDLPPGDLGVEQQTYQEGQYLLKDVAGTGEVVGVAWTRGSSITEDELEMMLRAVAGAIDASHTKRSTLRGPDGKDVESIDLATAKGPARMAFAPCGQRMINVVSIGEHVTALVPRVLASLHCTPDPAQENAGIALPVHVDLPAGWKVSPDGDPSGLQLDDGKSMVTVTPMPTRGLDDFPRAVNAMFSALHAEVTLGADSAGRTTFEGTLGGDPVAGFVWPVRCGAVSVVVLVGSPDRETANIAVGGFAAIRCLAPGEKPQTWK